MLKTFLKPLLTPSAVASHLIAINGILLPIIIPFILILIFFFFFSFALLLSPLPVSLFSLTGVSVFILFHSNNFYLLLYLLCLSNTQSHTQKCPQKKYTLCLLINTYMYMLCVSTACQVEKKI